MKKIKNPLLIVLTVFLVIIFTPVSDKLYEVFFGSSSGDLWALLLPKYIMGFFISYAFFVSFFVFLFGGKKKIHLAIALLGILGIFDFWIESLELFLAHILIMVLGWALAKGILMIKNGKK